MSIPSLDTKILWGKANARCAICRKKVVVKSAANNGRTDILFGEMCHIVGEKAEGCARCKSSMPLDDRNYYHNLILLCANDHEVIDKDEATYTIERLHQIKADFELWIDSRLDEATVDQADELYAKLVNLITDQMQLHRWATVCDCVINGRIPAWFVDGFSVVKSFIFKTNWPGKNLETEASINNLCEHLGVFVSVFMSNAQIDDSGKCFREMKGYRDADPRFNEHYELKAAYEVWEKRTHAALCNVVVALNEFTVTIRNHLNPKYFFLEGKFAVSDDFGVTNDMVPMEYIPTEYRPLNLPNAH